MDWRSAFTNSRAGVAAFKRQCRRDREALWSFPNEHFFRLTLEGVFVKVSDAFCGLLGHERSEFIGKRIDRFTSANVLDIPRHLGAIYHFGLFRGLWVFQHREGKGIVVRYAAELLPEGLIEARADPLAEHSFKDTTGKTG